METLEHIRAAEHDKNARRTSREEGKNPESRKPAQDDVISTLYSLPGFSGE